MSPARATLLHSPGWNEGKARYETLGKHKTKSYMSSFRSGTFNAYICFVSLLGAVRVVPPLRGSINISITTNPGLAPWALKKYRPVGALLHPTPIHLFYLMRLPSLS